VLDDRSDPVHSSPLRGRRHYLVVCLLLFCLTAIYVGLIVELDNTNLATLNGLWKCPWVHAWEIGSGRPIDTGDLLYLPAYGFLCRLIPEKAVSYGVHGEVVTFRKMAMLNAFFSALATYAVFLLALRLTTSIGSALLVAFAHATAGFVLLHSLNSEDITPAYTFFVIAIVSFFEYVFTRKIRWLVLCAGFVALTSVFHWTLLVPALVALGAAQLVLVVKAKHPIWLPAVFAGLFLAMVGVSTLLIHALYPDLGYTVWQVLYPPKAHPDGWAGVTRNKFLYLLIGMGNYFSGAQHLSDYQIAFRSPYLKSMLVSWLQLALVVGTASLALISRRTRGELRLMAGVCLVLFGVGEVEALYVLPQDPQWQMEPMFISVGGLIILLSFLRSRLSRPAFRLAVAALTLAFLTNGLWNAKLLAAGRGADSRAAATVRELALLFPPGGVTKVSHGYEWWNTWWYLEMHNGDYSDFAAENILLLLSFTDHAGISPAAAADLVRARIERSFAAGRRVVACALWTQEKPEFVGMMAAVIDNAKAVAYYDALRKAYRLGRTWETPAGRFVELLPADQRSP
jgi:hypothetical protein